LIDRSMSSPIRFRGHHCVVLSVIRLLTKQDNAPVKAQSYSHMLSTSKHS